MHQKKSPSLNDGLVHKRNRGYLPHWEKELATYFVTFRLSDSLPESVLREISKHKEMIKAARISGRDLLSIESDIEHRLSTKRIESFLDSGRGRCELVQPRIADVVLRSLQHWDGTRYDLLAWCVMPNHVHIVFRAFCGERLDAIVKSWKSFSARRVNSLLARTGAFWQREYYDHLIRDEDELEKAIEYTLMNPLRAGLKNWPWVGEKQL